MPKYTEVDQKEELGYKLQNSLESTPDMMNIGYMAQIKISFDTYQKLANITDTWRKEGKVAEKKTSKDEKRDQ